MTAALADHGLELPAERVLCGEWTERWGYDAVNQLLALDAETDAIFCGSDIIARGVLDGFHDSGWSTPEDVAVVGFDNWEIIAAQARPLLTTVDMNLHDLGHEAAQRLLAMLEGQSATGIMRFPCSLVVRESTGGLDPGRHGVAALDR